MRNTLLFLFILLVPNLLHSQGFLRNDNNPALWWGQNDNLHVVNHYVSVDSFPTIEPNSGIGLSINSDTELRLNRNGAPVWLFADDSAGNGRTYIGVYPTVPFASGIKARLEVSTAADMRAIGIKPHASQNARLIESYDSTGAVLKAYWDKDGFFGTRKLSILDVGGVFTTFWDFQAAAGTGSYLQIRDNNGDTILWLNSATGGSSDKYAYLRGDWRPEADNTYDIGRNTKRWKKAWFTDIDISGVCTGCSGLPVSDTQTIIKGSVDATKLLRFEVDGLTTATIRVLTPQDADYVLAGTNIGNTFTVAQTMANDLKYQWLDSASNPIGMLWLDGSNNFHVGPISAPASSGDVFFHARGADRFKLTRLGGTGDPLIEPISDIALSLGSSTTRIKGLHANSATLYTIGGGNALMAIQAGAGGGFVNLLGSASSATNWNFRFPAFAPGAANKVLRTTAGADNETEWIDASALAGLPVIDSTAVVKGSVDATKLLRFEVDGLTATTTRVLTPQDADYTLAGTNIGNVFSARQSIIASFFGNTVFDLMNSNSAGYSTVGFWPHTGGAALGHVGWRNSSAATLPSTFGLGTVGATNVIIYRGNVLAFEADGANVDFTSIPRPVSSGGVALGTSGRRWSNTFTNYLTLEGTAGSGGVVSNLNPSGDNAWDLGSATYRWKDLYLSGAFVAGEVDTYQSASYSNNAEAEADVTFVATAYSSASATNRGGFNMERARGTKASPSTVVAGDRLGVIGGRGYVTDGFVTSTRINIVADYVDGAGSNRIVAARMDFATMNTAGVLADRWTLQSAGHWTPSTDNAYTLGSSSLRPVNTYLRTTDVLGNLTISGGGGINMSGTITGATNMVDLSATQTISGQKTFSAANNYLANSTAFGLCASGNGTCAIGSTSARPNMYAYNLSLGSQLTASSGSSIVFVSGGFLQFTGSSQLVAANGANGVDATLSCGAGQAIKAITVSGGVVTSVSCGAP